MKVGTRRRLDTCRQSIRGAAHGLILRAADDDKAITVLVPERGGKTVQCGGCDRAIGLSGLRGAKCKWCSRLVQIGELGERTALELKQLGAFQIETRQLQRVDGNRQMQF